MKLFFGRSLDEVGKKRLLALVELLLRLADREPRGLIDLRKLLHAAGMRWPFHFKRVARGSPDVECDIRFDRPRGDDLAAGLFLMPYEFKDAIDKDAEFFQRFAFGGGQFVLSLFDKSFGN